MTLKERLTDEVLTMAAWELMEWMNGAHELSATPGRLEAMRAVLLTALEGEERQTCSTCRWCQKQIRLDSLMQCVNQDSPTANRLVRADFGCILHEPASPPDTPQPQEPERQ